MCIPSSTGSLVRPPGFVCRCKEVWQIKPEKKRELAQNTIEYSEEHNNLKREEKNSSDFDGKFERNDLKERPSEGVDINKLNVTVSDEPMDEDVFSGIIYDKPLKAYLPTAHILGPKRTKENPEMDYEKPRTFYPTMEEWKDFPKYIDYIERQDAHKTGLVKIVPPKEWIPRKKGYNPSDIKMPLDHPVRQNISMTSVPGAFKTLADRSVPQFTPEEYMRLATSEKFITPSHNSYKELEKLYWASNLDDKSAAPIYGADNCNSITDEDQNIVNIEHLDSLLKEAKETIPGVNLPYIYFGMWKATFSWHVEDVDLAAVNYLHYGAPKTWYCVPPGEGYKLEQVARKLFPEMATQCFNLLRHKAVMISPEVLRANGVKVFKMVQEERNMMVVFPHAYHAGFNHGFNIAESANFANERWIEYGKRFRDCVCSGRSSEVTIDMDPFVKKFQPCIYRNWRNGNDFALHPEDPPYLKRLIEDAKERVLIEDISAEEYGLLLEEVSRMRKIPQWFRERFVLDYNDEIEEFFVPDKIRKEEEYSTCEGPKARNVKRKLLQRLMKGEVIFDVKVRKMEERRVEKYMRRRKRYFRMLDEHVRQREEKKTEILEGKGNGSLGSGAARGVGFSGANVEDLVEKKANIICKANKKHKFKACKKCSGCIRGNCKDCLYCQDMVKYGGRGIMKQKCEQRVCVNPIVTTCSHCVWTL